MTCMEALEEYKKEIEAEAAAVTDQKPLKIG